MALKSPFLPPLNRPSSGGVWTPKRGSEPPKRGPPRSPEGPRGGSKTSKNGTCLGWTVKRGSKKGSKDPQKGVKTTPFSVPNRLGGLRSKGPPLRLGSKKPPFHRPAQTTAIFWVWTPYFRQLSGLDGQNRSELTKISGPPLKKGGPPIGGGPQMGISDPQIEVQLRKKGPIFHPKSVLEP